MSDSHGHSQDYSDNSDTGFIKTPTQLIVVIVLAFIIPIAAIYGIIQFVMSGEKPRSAPGMSDKAVAERIKPVGNTPEIEKGPSPLVPATAPVAAAVPAGGKGAAPAGSNGKAVYEATCKLCHDTGLANAPKMGDKTAWVPRMGQGMAGLIASAGKGKGGMPAKGGNPSLTDADLKAAIEYMTK